MKLFLLLLYAVLACAAVPGLLPDALANSTAAPSLREAGAEVPAAAGLPVPVVKDGSGRHAAQPPAGPDQGDDSDDSEVGAKAMREGGSAEVMDRRAGLFILILQILRVQK